MPPNTVLFANRFRDYFIGYCSNKAIGKFLIEIYPDKVIAYYPRLASGQERERRLMRITSKLAIQLAEALSWQQIQ